MPIFQNDYFKSETHPSSLVYKGKTVWQYGFIHIVRGKVAVIEAITWNKNASRWIAFLTVRCNFRFPDGPANRVIYERSEMRGGQGLVFQDIGEDAYLVVQCAKMTELGPKEYYFGNTGVIIDQVSETCYEVSFSDLAKEPSFDGIRVRVTLHNKAEVDFDPILTNRERRS